MSDTELESCSAQRSTEKAACDLVGDWVHIRRSSLQALRRKAKRADDIGPLRKEAALWRAGIKPGPASELFLDRLPDDVDLDDAEAVRLACAEITSAVLGARDELVGST
jgi:hypothetical protein